MLFVNQVFSNRVLWVSITSWLIAQIIKIIIEFLKVKRLDWRLLISSGGMPSSHTSFVVAMAMSTGMQEGFDTALFAISAVLSMIVMYDAAGVRRAAGKQAEVINMLVCSLENTGIKLDKSLKELLGHSPIEVGAGGILGIMVTYFFYS